jgi:hypothetical protein
MALTYRLDAISQGPNTLEFQGPTPSQKKESINQSKMYPTSCLFGSRFVYNPPSSYWLAPFQVMKKSAKGLNYFYLDGGMLEFFTHEP